MRRYLIGLAVGWACIGNVQAQTAPSIDWSGLYAGGAVGATRSQADTAMSVAKADGYFTSPDPAQIAAAGDGTLKQWRPSGSLYGGYGRQRSAARRVGTEGGSTCRSLWEPYP